MCILPDLIGFLRRVIKWMELSGLYYVVFMHNATLVDNSSIPKKVCKSRLLIGEEKGRGDVLISAF